MLPAATLGVPYCQKKESSRDVSQMGNILNSYRWLASKDGRRLRLATPFYDNKRCIYVIWDNIDRRVYYTDSDLDDMAKRGTLHISATVKWRELITCFPYFSKGTWNFYDRYLHDNRLNQHFPFPVDENSKEFIMSSVPGKDGIPTAVIVNDRRRRFIASLSEDWVKHTLPPSQTLATFRGGLKALPLPSLLEWRIYVPNTPFKQPLDQRLVKVKDLPGVIFLLDKYVRNILYWNYEQRTWCSYVLRDPGWGLFAGSNGRRKFHDWDRDCLFIDNGKWSWRDPLTLTLYTLEKGSEYGVYNRMYKILRKRLYDAFDMMHKIPKLKYELEDLELDKEIKVKLQNRDKAVGETSNLTTKRVNKLVVLESNKLRSNTASLHTDDNEMRALLQACKQRQAAIKGFLSGFKFKHNGADIEEILDEVRTNKYFLDEKLKLRDELSIKLSDETVSENEKRDIESKIKELDTERTQLRSQINSVKGKLTDDLSTNLKEEEEKQFNDLYERYLVDCDKLNAKQLTFSNGESLEDLQGDILQLDQLIKANETSIAAIDAELAVLRTRKSKSDETRKGIAEGMAKAKAHADKQMGLIQESIDSVRVKLEEIGNKRETQFDGREELLSNLNSERVKLDSVKEKINGIVRENVGDFRSRAVGLNVDSWFKDWEAAERSIAHVDRLNELFDGWMNKNYQMKTDMPEYALFNIDFGQITKLEAEREAQSVKIEMAKSKIAEIVTMDLKKEMNEFELVVKCWAKACADLTVLNESILNHDSEISKLNIDLNTYLSEQGKVKAASDLPVISPETTVHIADTDMGESYAKAVKLFKEGEEQLHHSCATLQAALCRYDNFFQPFVRNFVENAIDPSISADKNGRIFDIETEIWQLAQAVNGESKVLRAFIRSLYPSQEILADGLEIKMDIFGKPLWKYKCKLLEWKPVPELPCLDVSEFHRTDGPLSYADDSQTRPVLKWILKKTDATLSQETNGGSNETSKQNTTVTTSEQESASMTAEPTHGQGDSTAEPDDGVFVPSENDGKVPDELDESEDTEDKQDGQSGGNGSGGDPLSASYLGVRNGGRDASNRGHMPGHRPVRQNGRGHTARIVEWTTHEDQDVDKRDNISIPTLRVLKTGVPPDVTGRVFTFPPLPVRSKDHLPARTKKPLPDRSEAPVVHFYTDYRTWQTWRLPDEKKYSRIPPWECLSESTNYSVKRFITQSESNEEYHREMKNAESLGREIRDKRFTKKVCTGSKFTSFQISYDPVQQLNSIGTPFYPIDDVQAVKLGLEVSRKNGVMDKDAWDEEIAARRSDAVIRELKHFAEKNGVKFLDSGYVSSNSSFMGSCWINAKSGNEELRGNSLHGGAGGGIPKPENMYGSPPSVVPPDVWYDLVRIMNGNRNELDPYIMPRAESIVNLLTVKGQPMVLFSNHVNYSLLGCLDTFYKIMNNLGVEWTRVQNDSDDDALELMVEQFKTYNDLQQKIKHECEAIERSDVEIQGSEEDKVNYEEELLIRKEGVENLDGKLKNLETEQSELEKRKQELGMKQNAASVENKQMTDAMKPIFARLLEIDNEKRAMLAEREEINSEIEEIDSFLIRLQRHIIECGYAWLESIRRRDDLEAELLKFKKAYSDALRLHYGINSESINRILYNFQEGIDIKAWNDGRQNDSEANETLMDVVVLAHSVGVKIGILKQPNSDRVVEWLETRPGVQSQNPLRFEESDGVEMRCKEIMYVYRDESTKSYCLALPRKDYIRWKMVLYYHENIEGRPGWKSAFDEDRGKSGGRPKVANTGGSNSTPGGGGGNFTGKPPDGGNTAAKSRLVLDGDKVRRELSGDVPVFNLLVWEQPSTNYSFFSACRDAMAARLELKPNCIAPLAHFVRDLLDFLCYLPGDAIDRAKRYLKSTNKKPEAIRKYVIESLVTPILTKLSAGHDIFMSDDQLSTLSIVGIPVTACTNQTYAKEISANLGYTSLPLCFFMCSEVGNELQIDETYENFRGVDHACVPLLVLKAYGVQDNFENLCRGELLAHYYHLLCVPEVTHRKRENAARRRDVDGDLLNLMAAGFYDPNFDHLCHCEGEEHPMCSSSEFQRHISTAAMTLGVGGEDVITSQQERRGGSGSGSADGSMVAYGSKGYRVITHAPAVDGGLTTRETSRGYGFRPDQASSLIRNTEYQPQEMAVVDVSQAVTARDKKDTIVTNTFKFPRFEYFQSLAPGTYPGVNHISFLVSPLTFSSPARPVLAEDAVLRINAADSCTFSFGELIDTPFAEDGSRSLSGKRVDGANGSNDVNGVNGVDLNKILKEKWDYVKQNNNSPETKSIMPAIFFNVLNQNSPGEFMNYFLRFLVNREIGRVGEWNRRLENGDEALATDEEPPCEVYGGSIPSMVEFQGEYKDNFRIHTQRLIETWFSKSESDYDEFIKSFRENEAAADGIIEKFKIHGYMSFIVETVEAQWLESVHDSLAYAVSSKGGVSITPGQPWKSRADKEQHKIDNFMHMKLFAPRNTALVHWLDSLAFQKNNVKLTKLADVLDTSLEISKIGSSLTALVPYNVFKKNVLSKISDTFSIAEISGNDAPLTMDSFGVISRIYSSTNDMSATGSNFLVRDFPSVNFIVVECIHSSPLPGQLRVVCTSDPRGLSVAFATNELRDKLPTEKDVSMPKENSDLKSLLEKFRMKHLQSRVAIILRVPESDGDDYEFYLLKGIPTVKSLTAQSGKQSTDTGRSLSDVFAGAREGLKQLSVACNNTHYLKEIPDRPRPTVYAQTGEKDGKKEYRAPTVPGVSTQGESEKAQRRAARKKAQQERARREGGTGSNPGPDKVTVTKKSGKKDDSVTPLPKKHIEEDSESSDTSSDDDIAEAAHNDGGGNGRFFQRVDGTDKYDDLDIIFPVRAEDCHRCPRIFFMNYDSGSKLIKCVPQFARNRGYRIDQIEEVAKSNDARIFVFESVGDVLKIRNIYDYRVNIARSKLADTTGYFVCVDDRSPLKRLMPSVAGVIASTLEDAGTIQGKYLKYAGDVYKTVEANLKVLEGIDALVHSIGLRFSTKDENIVKSKGVSETIAVLTGPDHLIWRSRFKQELDVPKPPAPVLEQQIWDLTFLDDYVDHLLLFNDLLTSTFQAIMPEIIKQLEEYISENARISAMADPDFYYDHNLTGLYDSFSAAVRKTHKALGKEIPMDSSVEYSLKPVTHSARIRQAILAGRRVKEHSTAVEWAGRIQNEVSTLINDRFFSPQVSILRLFNDTNEGVRFFLEVSADNYTPSRFKRQFNLRITNNVKRFYDQLEKEVFEWDHNTKKTRRLDLLMPFWDNAKNTMCLMDFHSDYLAHIRKQRRINTTLQNLLRDETESEDKLISIESLKEERGEVETLLKRHEELHTFAWEPSVGQFVSTALVQKEEAENALLEAVHESRAAREKLNHAKKTADDATNLLERYNVLVGDYLYKELNSDHHTPRDQVLPSIKIEEYQRHHELAVEAWKEAKKEFVSAYKVFQEASAVWENFSGRSDMKPHLILKEGARLEYDQAGECHTWHCPENDMTYLLYDSARDTAASAFKVYSGDSGWNVQQPLPKWNSKTKSFDDEDVWFNPRDNSYYFLDYSRKTFIYNPKLPEPIWVPYRNVRASFIEMHPSACFDDISEMIEHVVGIKRREFYITEETRTSVKGINLEHFEPVTESRGKYRVAKLRLKCSNHENWLAGDTFDENGEILHTNTNGMLGRGRKKRYKANDDMQRNDSGRNDASKMWSDTMYELNTVRDGSKLPATFESIRFLGIVSGYPNNIAVDFGSSGHDVSWENPCVVFRESLFIYCNTVPGSSKCEIIVVPRRALHEGTTMEDMQTNTIITNPTGVFARNVERYWGHRPGTHDLCVESANIALRDPISHSFVARSVPDMRNLFSKRVKVFHDWLHSPQNWYWDDVRKGFSVFAFTPDMVWVNNRLVQQLAVYHVDMFYSKDGNESEFAKLLTRYLKDRHYLAACWMTLEGSVGYKFPTELRTEMNHIEYTRTGCPETVCEKVRNHYSRLMKHMPSSKHYDSFVKYYKAVTNRMSSPNITGPPQNVDLPQNAHDVKSIFANREVDTRRLFWRLFKAKFGHTYYDFLTDANFRAQVISKSPEPLGPDCCGVYAEPAEGKLFIEKWDAELSSAEKEGRTASSFQEFFSQYQFKMKPPKKIIVNEAVERDFPPLYAGFGQLSDEDREHWYWEQASVKFTGSHIQHAPVPIIVPVNNNDVHPGIDNTPGDEHGSPNQMHATEHHGGQPSHQAEIHGGQIHQHTVTLEDLKEWRRIWNDVLFQHRSLTNAELYEIHRDWDDVLNHHHSLTLEEIDEMQRIWGDVMSQQHSAMTHEDWMDWMRKSSNTSNQH